MPEREQIIPDWYGRSSCSRNGTRVIVVTSDKEVLEKVGNEEKDTISY